MKTADDVPHSRPARRAATDARPPAVLARLYTLPAPTRTRALSKDELRRQAADALARSRDVKITRLPAQKPADEG